uniref:Uncharacterized protein n=1 Tax=Knipowitschia caucasica TaxID=637954 RepID=A0AAV2LPD4_KNICA
MGKGASRANAPCFCPGSVLVEEPRASALGSDLKESFCQCFQQNKETLGRDFLPDLLTSDSNPSGPSHALHCPPAAPSNQHHTVCPQEAPGSVEYAELNGELQPDVNSYPLKHYHQELPVPVD